MTHLNQDKSATIPFLHSETEGSIHKRFRLVARLVPDHTAVDILSTRVTYAQLDGLSERIARAISMRLDLNKEAPVAIMIAQRHLALAAILGILKSGMAAVAYPQNSPLDQLIYLWNDTLNPLIVTSRQSQELTRGVVSSENDLLVIDDLVSKETEIGGGTALPESQPGDLAVISYTSGSTGMPKGVMQSHRMILHSAYLYQTVFQFTPQDRNAVLASFGFGAAKTQYFAALLSGATAYIPNIRKMKISSLIEWLEYEQITVLASPPISLLRQIMDEMKGGRRLPKVRLVLVGGDNLYRQDVDRFWELFGPETTLAFRLTGSETNLIRELHIHPGMKFSTDKIPVGYAVPDKEVFLVNENGGEVRHGEIGEIVVRSPYLASGYWRQPALTKERFKPDPNGSGGRVYFSGDLARINSAGEMELFGRKDLMVKIHGFSVHLESVDLALHKMAFIKEAVTLADPQPGGDKRLIAYLVSKTGEKPSVSEIRKEVTQYLPMHMLPSVFVWMESLPRTSTGKINRKALPIPARTRPDLLTPFVAPCNEHEESLSRIWKNLLQLDEIGVKDNFFELGGDSLSSVRMIIEAERFFEVKVPSTYLEEPTIAHLVEILPDIKKQRGFKSGKEIHSSERPIYRYRSRVRRFLNKDLSVAVVFQGLRHFVSSLLPSGAEVIFKGAILNKPYLQGCHQLSRWVTIPFVAHRLYRDQYKIFLRMLTELEGCQVDPEIAFRASLMANIISRIGGSGIPEDISNMIGRLRSSKSPFWSSLVQLIDQAPLGELDECISVSGLEILEHVHRAGRGVIILTYHSVSGRLAMAALPRRLDGKDIPTISQKRAKRESLYWSKKQARGIPEMKFTALKAGIALEGQRLLEQGRIVQFTSDLEYGREGYPVILAGRRYHLKRGFAELAINSGAAVVPQYTKMRPDGHLLTTFMSPLIPGSGSRDAQINNLLDQYAEFINTSWRLAPESLRWSRILRHFNQPIAVPEP